jgi:hypothetical protein
MHCTTAAGVAGGSRQAPHPHPAAAVGRLYLPMFAAQAAPEWRCETTAYKTVLQYLLMAELHLQSASAAARVIGPQRRTLHPLLVHVWLQHTTVTHQSPAPALLKSRTTVLCPNRNTCKHTVASLQYRTPHLTHTSTTGPHEYHRIITNQAAPQDTRHHGKWHEPVQQAHCKKELPETGSALLLLPFIHAIVWREIEPVQWWAAGLG